MIDLQSSADHREVALGRVGINGLALPIRILEKAGGFQHVVATAGLFVDVPKEIRGTHLSRFVELLTEWANEPVSSREIERLLLETRSRTGSLIAEVALAFKYFLPKRAPVSGKVGVLDYECQFRGRLSADGFAFTLGVAVPVTTLCPCSKEISDEGAHNQRAIVRVGVECKADAFIWLEDLIATVESQGSCAIYPILKRVDEKFVTEAAYQNPKFVEDVVRDLIVALRETAGVSALTAECESQESIHNHSAVASAMVTSVGPEAREARFREVALS